MKKQVEVKKGIEVIDKIISTRLKEEDERFVNYDIKITKTLKDPFFLLSFNPFFLLGLLFIFLASLSETYYFLQPYIASGFFSFLFINIYKFISLSKLQHKVNDIFNQISNRFITKQDIKLLQDQNFEISLDAKITYHHLLQLKLDIMRFNNGN